MQLVALGSLPLLVSRVCLGTGSSGNRGPSQQAQVAVEDYAGLLLRALSLGVNFWDTADNYATHPHVARALRQVPRQDVVVTSKVYSATAEATGRDFTRCLEELGVSYLDICLLHEVDSLAELESKMECLEELHRRKQDGLLRGVGVSTHSIEVLERLVVHPLVEVVFTNYNVANEHMDASRRDYETALERAYSLGKGVYVHKTLNEGKLAHRYREALTFNLTRPFIHSVAMGISTHSELHQLVEVALSVEAPPP